MTGTRFKQSHVHARLSGSCQFLNPSPSASEFGSVSFAPGNGTVFTHRTFPLLHVSAVALYPTGHTLPLVAVPHVYGLP